MLLTKHIKFKNYIIELIKKELKLASSIIYKHRIKPLVWKQTNYHEFTLNTRPAHCETWQAATCLKTYNVHKAVGGDYFFYWSGMTHNYSGHPFQQGYNSDADSILGQKKYRCESIEDGKAVCEAHWQLLAKLNISPHIDV